MPQTINVEPAAASVATHVVNAEGSLALAFDPATLLTPGKSSGQVWPRGNPPVPSN